MKTIFYADNIYGGEIVLKRRTRNLGYFLICAPRPNEAKPIITNKQAADLAIALLEDLGLGWLPYPENKPKVSGEYLVSIEYPQGRRAVKSDHYHNDTENWDKYRVVYAFRPLPEPYGGEK
jgi:hypothetical protein